MSRNLCEIKCLHCGTPPRLTSPLRLGTDADFGRYASEYRGMVVADAECPLCGAEYLAWVAGCPGSRRVSVDEPFFDLSYRSTFNDEPGASDLPKREVIECPHCNGLGNVTGEETQ